MRPDGTPLVSGFSLSVWPDLQSEVLRYATRTNPDDQAVYTGPNKRDDVFAYGLTVMVSAQIHHRPLSSDDCKDRR